MSTSPNLPPDSLRARTDARTLGFDTTAELQPLDGVIGQARALSAADFGVAMRAPGYNVFVVGPPATGKVSTMRDVLERAAATEEAPGDVCYVHNFDDAHRPRLLHLPVGRGRELQAAMKRVAESLALRLRRTWESEEFTRRARQVADPLQGEERRILGELEERARAEGFTVAAEKGVTIALSPDGKPLTEEQWKALPLGERERLQARARELDAQAEPLLRELRRVTREMNSARQELVRASAREVIAELLGEVRASFAGTPSVATYLDAVVTDVVDHAEAIAEPPEANELDDPADEEEDEATATRASWAPSEGRPEKWIDRYRVNVFVDRDGQRGAPVVSEPNPTYRDLFGRIEHRAHLGTLVTDFMLVKPGALHRANGGYLLLEARDLVADPYAWSALKKALRSGSIRMEEPHEELHLLGAASLAPEPVPLAVKVILVGEPDLYHLLYEADSDLPELFKVKADFEDTLPRTVEVERLFGRFVASLCSREGLWPLTSAAVALLVEEAARRAEHQRRVSARFGELVDLVREAAYFAKKRAPERAVVDDVDVRQAVEQRAHRGSLVEEQLQRMTVEGEIRIATTGAAVGEVNGLEVYSIGEREFGRPFRISVRVRPGRPGVLDVEREAGLGGAIHSKGVLVLSGFLGGRYASDVPLAMSATLVAEQSYSMVDGDSASCAELCALLSALARVPLRQCIAVTGAVSQAGEVQAVGGLNAKIEGFFDLCRARGLTGAEGVLIPAPNARHLMLRADVVAAVRAGQFFVRAIATVDEALEALTGVHPGAPDAGGRFPADSFNWLVERRLEEFFRAVRPA